MKKKSDKQKDLEALKKDFEKAQNIFLAGFEKLTVQQAFFVVWGRQRCYAF